MFGIDVEKRKRLFDVIRVVLFVSFVFFSFCGPTRLFSISGKYFPIAFYISFISLLFFAVDYVVNFKNDYYNSLLLCFVFLFTFLSFTSLAPSYVLHYSFAGLYGTSPLKVWLFSCIKYFYDFACIFYLIIHITKIRKEIIFKLIDFSIIAWSVVGLLQFIVFTFNNSTLNSIYTYFDFLKIFQSTELMEQIRMNYGTFRFYGLGSEPASNCMLISCVFIPYLIFRICTYKNNGLKRLFLTLVETLLVLLFSFLTKSSSVYVALLSEFLFFSLILLFRFNGRKKYSILLLIGICLLVGIVFVVPTTRKLFIDGFKKIYDVNNYSTQHRYSTIWNDFLIFCRHPIFGVGDGNQGYFYRENITGTWMARNFETIEALKGKSGLMAGGAALPSIISGYGILGLIAIATCLWKVYKTSKIFNEKESVLEAISKSILFVSFVLSFATIGIHRNYILFIALSIPFVKGYSNGSKIYLFRNLNNSELSSFIEVNI